MKGVRILAGTRGFLSSNAQTDCGIHPPFSSVVPSVLSLIPAAASH